MKVMLKSLVLSSILLIPFNIALAEDKDTREAQQALLEQVLTELDQLKEEIKTMKKPIPSVKEKIRAGKKFAVAFYDSCSKEPELCLKDQEGFGTNNTSNGKNNEDPLGNFLMGQIYQVQYFPETKAWEVSGFKEWHKELGTHKSVSGKDNLEDNEMLLWGYTFRFDDSANVFYEATYKENELDLGLVGRIVFLEE